MERWHQRVKDLFLEMIMEGLPRRIEECLLKRSIEVLTHRVDDLLRNRIMTGLPLEQGRAETGDQGGDLSTIHLAEDDTRRHCAGQKGRR